MATTTITQSVNTESGYVGYFGFAGNPPTSGTFDSGVEPRPSTRDEARAFIRAELVRWQDAARRAGLKPE